VTKHVVRRAHPHTEVTLILSLAYLSFIVADGLRCSGLMAVFFCGALCSHYAKYNLSKEGRETMHNVARTIAHLAETMVFPASPRAGAPRPSTDRALAQVFVYFGFNILPTVAPSCSTGQTFRVAPRPAPEALRATACGLACTRGRQRVGSGDEVRPSRRRSQLRRGAGKDVAEDPHPSPLTQPEIDCRSSRHLSSSRCACASCPARSTSSRSAFCSIISPRGAIRADPISPDPSRLPPPSSLRRRNLHRGPLRCRPRNEELRAQSMRPPNLPRTPPLPSPADDRISLSSMMMIWCVLCPRLHSLSHTHTRASRASMSRTVGCTGRKARNGGLRARAGALPCAGSRGCVGRSLSRCHSLSTVRPRVPPLRRGPGVTPPLMHGCRGKPQHHHPVRGDHHPVHQRAARPADRPHSSLARHPGLR
jgi:hypothetical protein